MNFGQKLRRLRIEKGLTQQELAERLGYKSNNYVSDVENGHSIPSRGKLRKIARALDVPFKMLEDMLLESKLEALGIKEPELLSLFKDIPSLPEKDKRAIINAYLKVKERRMKKKKNINGVRVYCLQGVGQPNIKDVSIEAHRDLGGILVHVFLNAPRISSNVGIDSIEEGR
jgi:transcriptional regulator with XRE-family HTH domain